MQNADSSSQDDWKNTNSFVILDRATDRVQSFGFNRRTRLIILSAVGVLTSTVAALQLELSTEARQHRQDDSNNTNSFADLARVADRVQTSACNRRTRLMILNRFV